MSHVATSSVVISDISILKRVINEKFPKLKWKEDQRTYRWFGQWVKDFHGDSAAYKHGIDPKDYGKCAHAIEVDGCIYDIGVVERPDGQGYSLVWDFYGHEQKFNDAIGKDGALLMAEYSREFIMDYASRNGFIMNEYTDSEGNLVLDMTAV